MAFEVIRRVQRVEICSEDANRGGDVGEFSTQLPLRIVIESGRHDERCRGPYRGVLAFSVLPVPCGMIGDQLGNARRVLRFGDKIGPQGRHRGSVEVNRRINEQISGCKAWIECRRSHRRGATERMPDDQIPRPRMGGHDVSRISVEDVTIGTRTLSVATQIRSDRWVAGRHQGLTDLPPHRSGRTETVQEQHTGRSCTEAMRDEIRHQVERTVDPLAAPDSGDSPTLSG
jgi:hypothetical protein